MCESVVLNFFQGDMWQHKVSAAPPNKLTSLCLQDSEWGWYKKPRRMPPTNAIRWPLPVPPWNVGFILANVPFKIDSYTSAPDLKRSEGLWVHNVLLLCGELRGEGGRGKKKKRREGDDDDLTEPTLNDGSLALKRECLCDCVYACVWVSAHTLIQVQTKSL